MYLAENNIRKLTEDDLSVLFYIITFEKLQNVATDYRKNPESKGKPYGKGDRIWHSVDNDRPDSGFVRKFLIQKLQKDEPIEECVLQAFESKFLKAILGKKDFQNATPEMIEKAINSDKYNDYQKNIMKRLLGEDIDPEEFEQSKQNGGKKPVSRRTVLQLELSKRVRTEKDNKAEWKNLEKEKSEAEEKNKELQKKLKMVKSELEKKGKEYQELSKSYKNLEKENEEIKAKYDGMMKRLQFLLTEEGVSFSEEDFEKESLSSLRRALEDAFQASEQEKLKRLFVKAYILLSMNKGGKE